MKKSSPTFANSNVVLEKKTPLTNRDKQMFSYFGVGAKIKPPFRILNPHRIKIGDNVVIHEYCNINAFQDASALYSYIDEQYKKDFSENAYQYDSSIEIGHVTQIGRFFFAVCTNNITVEDHVLISERVFIGDHNHSFGHPQVPIIQQPNRTGEPVLVKRGSWIGVGAAILKGTKIGSFSVVGANSVCSDVFPDHSVIGTEKATLLFRSSQNSGGSDLK